MASKFASLGLAVERPFRVLLTLPSGDKLQDSDGKQAYIDVLSGDSRAARRVTADITNERLKGRARNTAATIEASKEDILVAVTTGWYLVGMDGTPIPDAPCTPENVRDFYSAPEMAEWRDQVERAVYARENFMPAPPSA